MTIETKNIKYRDTLKYQKHLSFKGYDARPLKAVVMTLNDEPESFNIIKQMSDIGKKEGFKLYFCNRTNRTYANIEMIKKFFKDCTYSFVKWAQDMAILTPDNRVLQNWNKMDADFIKRIACLTKAKYSDCEDFIEGGNLFFVKNADKNELLVGANELKNNSFEFLKKMYGVSKVVPIPQADFHVDLFIRPLDNKKILVADDKLVIKQIKKAIANIDEQELKQECKESELADLEAVKKSLQKLLKDFSRDVRQGKNPKADEIAAVLNDNGYTPIMVPGRIYYSIPDKNKDDLVHYLNYMNAIVHKKKDGSLVFITNKSKLNEDCGITKEISEKIGFDFEKMWIDSLKPYVSEKNIYFISGTKNKMANLLEKEGGGIHCLCNEIPSEVSK